LAAVSFIYDSPVKYGDVNLKRFQKRVLHNRRRRRRRCYIATQYFRGRPATMRFIESVALYRRAYKVINFVPDDRPPRFPSAGLSSAGKSFDVPENYVRQIMTAARWRLCTLYTLDNGSIIADEVYVSGIPPLDICTR